MKLESFDLTSLHGLVDVVSTYAEKYDHILSDFDETLDRLEKNIDKLKTAKGEENRIMRQLMVLDRVEFNTAYQLFATCIPKWYATSYKILKAFNQATDMVEFLYKYMDGYDK